MSTPGFCLRHIVFLGPKRPPAAVAFGPGLNIVYGASDTGKSFLVEAIDFMLGGKPPLRDIPERIDYDRILLGIETYAGEAYTIFRSIEGGPFRLYKGLHTEMPPEDIAWRKLGPKHSGRDANNLSSFLLQQSGLAGKRVLANKREAKTNSLSFRNVARLLIIAETEITERRSPLSDGNKVADTPNFATFKLMLTGVDDSALVASAPATKQDQTREAQVELLDQIIAEHRARLKNLTGAPNELEDQLSRIEASLHNHATQIATPETELRQLSGQRRELGETLEQGKDRRADIISLLERFDLLDQHYRSDLDRLRGIEETGTLFIAFSQGSCPLCGAAPEHRGREADCDGDVDGIITAAQREIAKIILLRTELIDTIATLKQERTLLDHSLPKLEERIRDVSTRIDTISPQLSQVRASYAELANKRSELREALGMLRILQDFEKRRALLDRDEEDQKGGDTVSDGDLPTATADEFAQQVEAILKAWHFPRAERVSFNPKTRDLVIADKDRIARGKGLRAITHAAFTIGLLEYCRTHKTPHPGFIVLDSPLLAYREPDGEGTEDDLRGTDLKEHFYAYLAAQGSDRQTIIVENDDPPQDIQKRPQVTMFTGNSNTGRFGLFLPI